MSFASRPQGAEEPHGAPAAAPARLASASSALELTLGALRPLLADPEVTELCINRPREVFIETRAGWRREVLAFADFDWCQRFAKLVANATRQRVDECSPLLSASLPSGERVQLVLPPATTLGCVAITIRRPSSKVWSVEELGTRGALRPTRSVAVTNEAEAELLRLHAAGDYESFLRLAVQSRCNILVWVRPALERPPGPRR